MYKDELQHIQKKLIEIIKQAGANPQEAINKLLELQKEASRIFTEESAEYYNVCASIYEGIGDINAKLNKLIDAEKSYKEMMQFSSKLFQIDKEKFDYRQAMSHYKLATFYRRGLQCHVPVPKPKQLNDAQKKVFAITEALYKNALACIVEKSKKGSLRHVELYSTIMNEIAVMYTCVGNYEKASELALNGVNVDKAIYDQHDDKKHGLKLATRMNTLAVIYSYMKDVQKTADTLEDTIFVIEQHEKEEPAAAGMMLGRNHLNLGVAYKQLEEEKEHAEEEFLKGLNKILEVNAKTGDKMLDDVLMAYMLTGDYYREVKDYKKSRENYLLAMENAKVLLERTKNKKYKTIIDRLEKAVNGTVNS